MSPKKSHPKVALKVPGGTSLDLLEVGLWNGPIFEFSHCDSSWMNFTCRLIE
jgi:hypothetical protein